MSERTRVITLRLPESTHQRAMAAATATSLSLNKFCLESVEANIAAVEDDLAEAAKEASAPPEC